MSGAIGSQVINISLGVGLPALFVCVTSNGMFFVEQTDSLWLLTSLAFVVIFMHVSTTLPVWNLMRGLLVKHAAITKNGAIMQVSQYPTFSPSLVSYHLLPFLMPFFLLYHADHIHSGYGPSSSFSLYPCDCLSPFTVLSLSSPTGHDMDLRLCRLLHSERVG
jgi:hypothetical protein